MLLIGLTGGIASGKSTVARHLIENGVKLIDADLIARQIVEPGTTAWRKIKEEFGSSVITNEGTIDREKLAKVIFHSEEKRKLLNRITHPHIHRQIFKQIVAAFFSFEPYVVLDLPLLFETARFSKYFHKIIVVDSTEQIQIDRLEKRNNLAVEEAQARISSQIPLKEKCRLADYVVDNNGQLEDTLRQVDSVFNEIKASKVHLKYRFLILFLLFNTILFIYVFVNRLFAFIQTL